VVSVVVIAGVLGVVALVAGVRSLGRSARQGVQTVQPPAPGDHWHVAYGVNVCGSWQPPLTDRGEDQYGIHTHGDGVIHVHPFTSEAAGTSATFGVFANQVGMVLADDSVRLPDGTSRADGDDCDGQPASWRLVEWDVDDPRATPVERFGGFAAATYGGDRHAMTLAFLPDGAEVPKPPTIPALDQLTDAPTPTTTGPRRDSPTTTSPTTTSPTTTSPTTTSPTTTSPTTTSPGSSGPASPGPP
jgi:hypothetical protein